jgi:hypothetical protein
VTRYAPIWVQAGDYPAGADRRLIGALYPRASASGMTVTPASGMTVNVAAGDAVVRASNNTGAVLCSSDAVEQVTLTPAPASGTNRYDLIVCQARANDIDGGANNDWLFGLVTGSAAATPTPPAVPANATPIAQIYVPGASVTVTAGNITDTRPSRLDKPWNSAWGTLAVATVSAPQTGIVAQTDLTGFSAGPVSILANRVIRVSAYVPQILQNTAAGTQVFSIRDDQNQTRSQMRNTAMAAGTGGNAALWWIAAGLAAQTRTYKLSASTTAGTMDLTMGGPNPGILLVEDLGPNPGSPGT